MIHLFDTCTLLSKIYLPSSIIRLSKYINEKKEYLAITNVIYDELNPPHNLEKSEKEKSNGILSTIETCVKNNIGVSIINVNENENYRRNLNDIRKRYYSHLGQSNLLRRIRSGEITREEGERLKRKDLGECSCIAIALEDPQNNIIISEDEGRVCERPEINIFDKYREKYNLQILKYDKWKYKHCDL